MRQSVRRLGGQALGISSLLAVFLTVQPSNRLTAQTPDTTSARTPSAPAPKLIKPVSALWRSLLIPGWGQACTGRNFTGAAFVVGERGTTLLRQGSAWMSQAPITTRFLRHVFGLDPAHVYAVGDSGTAIAWNGAEWRDMGLSSNALIRGVWGTAPDDLFAVGSGGAIFRFDGVRWYSMQSPTQRELRAVWGFGPTEVYAAGEEGVILRFNGSTWSQLTTNNRSLILSLEPTTGGKLTAVGARATIIEGER